MPWRRRGHAWARLTRHYRLRVTPRHHRRYTGERWWRVTLTRRRDGAVLADSRHCDSRRYAKELGVRLRRYFREKERYERRYGSTIWHPNPKE